MAERRMFSKKITDTDAFIEMPMSTQCLYFHLAMHADDEGFVGNPVTIQRSIGASGDDLKILLAKRFILGFDSGVVVIKHWKIHNYIQNDRFNNTTYTEEKATLTLDEKKAYTEKNRNVYILDTQDSIDKISIDKNSKENINTKENPEERHKYGEYKHVLLTDKQYNKLIEEYGEELTKSAINCVDQYCQMTGKTYKDYNLTIRNWGIDSAKKKMPEKKTGWGDVGTNL